VMLAIPGVRASVYAIPVWVGIIYVAYRLRLSKGKALAAAR